MNWRRNLLKLWNFWPPFWGSGIRIQEVSSDYRYLKVKLKLRFWTANYVGTLYGGSLFSMTDPFYMVMLIRNLGSEYLVWDKSANIKFLKPGRTDAVAEFRLSEDFISSLKQELSQVEKTTRIFKIPILDQDGNAIAEVEKTLSIRKKMKPNQKESPNQT